MFLHGLAGDHEVFSRQVPDVTTDRRAIRVDARGHGLSPVPEGPWTIADFAADFVALLDRLQLDAVHVVGHSGGGVFAMRMALDHPERVRSLFLVGTSAELKREIAEKSYSRWAAVAEQEGLEAALKVARLPVPEGVRPEHGAGFARTCRAISRLGDEPLAPDLGRIRVPTAFVVGGEAACDQRWKENYRRLDSIEAAVKSVNRSIRGVLVFMVITLLGIVGALYNFIKKCKAH